MLKDMAKRISKAAGRPKRPSDVNQLAQHLVRASIEMTNTQSKTSEEPSDLEISRVMAALGRKGGKIGGKRRLETLTQEQRSRIAYEAAQARWSKQAKKP